MRALAARSMRKSRALLIVAVTAAAFIVANSSASAAPVTINLCAEPGTATLTGAVMVPIWGFHIGACGSAAASLPGPQLVVNEGDTVTVNITNGLPAGHTLTFEIPGVTFNAGATDVAAGSTGTVSFTASAPGTYLYQAGGGEGRQAAMGLAGALIVNSLTGGQAYDTATTAYDTQATVVLGAVDPNFNAAPDTFDMYSYRATYWLINGKAYPDTAGITATAGPGALALCQRGIRQLVDGAARPARARGSSGRPPAEQPVRRERRDDPGWCDRGRHRNGASRRRAEHTRIPLVQPAIARDERRPDRAEPRSGHRWRNAHLHSSIAGE
jgi:Multicopper oxidase